MPRRPPEQPTFRLFLAVEVPEAAVVEMVAWQQKYLIADRALRMTQRDQLHITLVFLGDKTAEERDEAARILGHLSDLSAFEVAAAGMVGLPSGRHPRVVAVKLEDPAGRLTAMHDELAVGLVAKKLYQREKRPFFPHLTIARARGWARLDLAAARPDPCKFTAVRVTLYNSILKPSGAVHEALKTVQLI